MPASRLDLRGAVQDHMVEGRPGSLLRFVSLREALEAHRVATAPGERLHVLDPVISIWLTGRSCVNTPSSPRGAPLTVASSEFIPRREKSLKFRDIENLIETSSPRPCRTSGRSSRGRGRRRGRCSAGRRRGPSSSLDQVDGAARLHDPTAAERVTRAPDLEGPDDRPRFEGPVRERRRAAGAAVVASRPALIAAVPRPRAGPSSVGSSSLSCCPAPTSRDLELPTDLGLEEVPEADRSDPADAARRIAAPR